MNWGKKGGVFFSRGFCRTGQVKCAVQKRRGNKKVLSREKNRGCHRMDPVKKRKKGKRKRPFYFCVFPNIFFFVFKS